MDFRDHDHRPPRRPSDEQFLLEEDPHDTELTASSYPSVRRLPQIDVEKVVAERLRSPWGRPVHPVPLNHVSLLHQWIASIRTSASSTLDDRRNVIQWNDVEERCATHPHEASHLDRRGRTCLHSACAKKPPMSTVRAILEACGATGRHGECILERDKHGRTPLALAISSNANLQVIEALLKTCPKAASINDHLGYLPLHLCSQYDSGQEELTRVLLAAFPEAASRETFNGRTPLHSAIEGRAPIEVVRQLVKGRTMRLVSLSFASSASSQTLILVAYAAT